MEVFFQMRFSYCGKPSGILPRRANKSETIKETSVSHQFDLLERITLPSLQDQVDPSFRLLILCSIRMPQEEREHLTWLLNHYLPGRSEVLYSRPMIPGRVFRRHMQNLGRGDTPVIQTQVVEGDAFGRHFVKRLREHSIEKWANLPLGSGGKAAKGTFLSFKRGFNLGLRHKRFTGLEQTSSPLTPFALSLVSRPSSRYNPMLINPDGLGVKTPHASIMTQQIYCMRVLSGERADQMLPVERRLLSQAQDEFSIVRSAVNIPVSKDQVLQSPTDVGVVRLRRMRRAG